MFCRFTGEIKPIYADLTSLASIDLLARSVRRSRRKGRRRREAHVVEMLPALDQAWLTDAQGQRYASELRMVAVDQKAAYQAAQTDRKADRGRNVAGNHRPPRPSAFRRPPRRPSRIGRPGSPRI